MLATCIDLSKAFNRTDHSIVIEDLYDMDTPPWLLNILVFYLSKRPMVLQYNGNQSKRQIPQGGEPQGAYLGSPIFIVKDPSLGHLCQETFWYLQQSLNLRL